MTNRANTGGNHIRLPSRNEILLAGLPIGTMAVAAACGKGSERVSATPTPAALTGQQIIQAEQTVSKSLAANGRAHPLIFNEAGHLLVGYVTKQHHSGKPDAFDATLFEPESPDYPAYEQPPCKLYENDESPFPTGSVHNIEVDTDSHGDITSVIDTDMHKPVTGKDGYDMPVAFQYEPQK